MNALQVSQVNKYIKDLISRDFLLNDFWVRGEISNFKNHSSGHMYFTVKDESSILRCVMFRAYCSNLRFIPANGMKVIIRGGVSVFERDGQYQLYCHEMQPDGLGALYAAFEQLKLKLKDEGLFDPGIKKKLPAFPERIGVVTSCTGAVIKDIMNVSLRRFPNASIVLFPVSVQGSSSAREIAHALDVLNKNRSVDVIILARGGGSLEELWAFNEELVARAIYKSQIPVVSAVGHETDYTISDMAADLRAPTPSAAAELVVPDAKELKWKVDSLRKEMVLAVQSRVSDCRSRLQKIENSMPLRQPYEKVYQLRMILDLNHKLIQRNIALRIRESRDRLRSLIVHLNSLSPLAVLARGYCIASDYSSGKVIKSVKQVCRDGQVNIKFADGRAECKVVDIKGGQHEF